MEKINTDGQENLGIFGLLQNIKFIKENKDWIMPLSGEIMQAIAARQESTQKKFDTLGNKLNEMIDQFNKLEEKVVALENKISKI